MPAIAEIAATRVLTGPPLPPDEAMAVLVTLALAIQLAAQRVAKGGQA